MSQWFATISPHDKSLQSQQPHGLTQPITESAAEHLNFPSGDSQSARINALKEYLASPPPHLQSVYERTILREQNELKQPKASVDGTIIRKKKIDLFMLRRSPFGFVLVNSEDPKLTEDSESVSGTNFLTISGSISNEYWSLEPALITMKMHGTNQQRFVMPANLVFFERTDQSHLDQSPYFRKVLMDLKNSEEIVLFGIRECALGSIKWNGNNFTGRNKENKELQGVIVTSNGNSLQIQYSLGEATYLVDLKYPASTTNLLPNSFISRKTKPIVSAEHDDAYAISFVTFDTNHLDANSLYPDKFIREVPCDYYTVSNGIMRETKTGKIVEDREIASPRNGKLFKGILCVLFAVPLVVFLLNHRQAQNQIRTSSKPETK